MRVLDLARDCQRKSCNPLPCFCLSLLLPLSLLTAHASFGARHGGMTGASIDRSALLGTAGCTLSGTRCHHFSSLSAGIARGLRMQQPLR